MTTKVPTYDRNRLIEEIKRLHVSTSQSGRAAQRHQKLMAAINERISQQQHNKPKNAESAHLNNQEIL